MIFKTKYFQEHNFGSLVFLGDFDSHEIQFAISDVVSEGTFTKNCDLIIDLSSAKFRSNYDLMDSSIFGVLNKKEHTGRIAYVTNNPKIENYCKNLIQQSQQPSMCFKNYSTAFNWLRVTGKKRILNKNLA